MLQSHDSLDLCSIAEAPELEAALLQMDQKTSPHMLQRKNLARILKGKQAGKRALGFGRNEV